MQKARILGLSLMFLMGLNEVSWAESMANGAVVQPLSMYSFPVESGLLESRVEFQTMHIHTSNGNRSFDALLFSVDGQLVVKESVEFGLTLPLLNLFMEDEELSGLGFGDLLLNLKGKVAGGTADSFAMAVFLNTLLPTHTGAKERSYASFRSGAAASFWRGRFAYGGDFGLSWDYSEEGSDALVNLIDLFGGVRLHRLISVSLSLQIGVPIYPVVDVPALALLSGVQLTSKKGFTMGLALRVAANDNARAYNDGGRMGLMINIGYRKLDSWGIEQRP